MRYLNAMCLFLAAVAMLILPTGCYESLDMGCHWTDPACEDVDSDGDGIPNGDDGCPVHGDPLLQCGQDGCKEYALARRIIARHRASVWTTAQIGFAECRQKKASTAGIALARRSIVRSQASVLTWRVSGLNGYRYQEARS